MELSLQNYTQIFNPALIFAFKLIKKSSLLHKKKLILIKLQKFLSSYSFEENMISKDIRNNIHVTLDSNRS